VEEEDAHSAEYDSKSSLAHVRNVLNAIFTKKHSIKNRLIVALIYSQLHH
jgi:hypothetical protein